MKNIILTLGFVLGLGGLTATQAQMRIYNSNLVKFGDVNTNAILTSGLEVAMPNFLFRGNSAKFTIGGKTLELKNNLSSSVNSATAAVSPDATIIPMSRIIVTGPNNGWEIGTTGSLVNVIYTTTAYSYNYENLSDRRYKTNIQDLAPALDKVMRLRPVTFDYLDGKDGQPLSDATYLNKMGLIAQELQEVVPEAVRYREADDIYTVNYPSLIPLLIKTIQEQQTQIESQQLQIEDLQMAVAADNAALSTPAFSNVNPDGSPAGTLEATGNRLWSNVPNPFKRETRIRYALTDDVREAQLCIYDLSGRQLSCHRLNDRGQSEFVLRAASLNPGIYLYSLIADRQVVDTHRMVVTE